MKKVIGKIYIQNVRLALLCLRWYICSPSFGYPFWMANIDYWYLYWYRPLFFYTQVENACASWRSHLVLLVCSFWPSHSRCELTTQWAFISASSLTLTWCVPGFKFKSSHHFILFTLSPLLNITALAFTSTRLAFSGQYVTIIVIKTKTLNYFCNLK